MKQLQKKSRTADLDTRSRLVEAAGAIFAEFGYQAATTRQICIRAHANAAAVNYHFGDKLGLYKAALESLIGRHTMIAEERALAAMPPELALQSLIGAMFESLSGSKAAEQYTRLMAHEMAEPTPGLTMVVDKIIRPRARLLCTIIARLTSSSARSPQTRMAAHSIMAQIVHYAHARPVIALLWPNWSMNAATKRQIVSYVTSFSLAGVREAPSARRRSGRDGGKAVPG